MVDSANSALEVFGKISSEVDETNIRLLYSNRCIKAQILLGDRLRKETQRKNEVGIFISSANSRLDTEIKNAELELKSLLTAKETIQSSSVEIKKILLLDKARTLEMLERVEGSEKKYEELWLQCKERYESIPFVKEWLKHTNKTQALKDRIISLGQEIKTLTLEDKIKKFEQAELDKKRIIEIAKFLVLEVPIILKNVADTKESIKRLSLKIAEYQKEKDATVVQKRNILKLPKDQENSSNQLLDEAWLSIRSSFQNDLDTLTMPKLHRDKIDKDVVTVNEKQIKKVAISPQKRAENITGTQEKYDDFYSSCFFKSYLTRPELKTTTYNESEPNKYAKNKLINILEDLSVDNTDAVKIISTVNPTSMQKVSTIGKNISMMNVHDDDIEKTQNETEMDCNKIEEVTITASGSNNILDPPIQFSYFAEENTYKNSEKLKISTQRNNESLGESKNSQDDSQKKKVSFDLPVIQEVSEEENIIHDQTKMVPKETGDVAELSGSSQLNTSTGMNDERFSIMKELILKQNKLDLSLDFTYAEIDMKKEKNVVTSKFFTKINKPHFGEDKPALLDEKVAIVQEANVHQAESNHAMIKNFEDVTDEANKNQKNIEDEDMVSPLKDDDKAKMDKPISGFLFRHGPHGIPDSLDDSISTTGYEEGEFPHCIDSSLLLSPKADMSMPTKEHNAETFSQEVPNFLTGLKNAGFSFFGKSSTSDARTSNQGTFNFNFGEDDKKGRGGLFSMFQ